MRPGMSERINVAFNETKTFTKNVVLIISSCGGETGEMHQTISVLRDIKRTHVLTTAVVRGGNCSSACVPIFLQGSARMAALASVWLLHHAVAEVTDVDTITRRTDAAATERVIKDYFEPAGVSKRWLKKVRAKIKSGELLANRARLVGKQERRVHGAASEPRKARRQYQYPALHADSGLRGFLQRLTP